MFSRYITLIEEPVAFVSRHVPEHTANGPIVYGIIFYSVLVYCIVLFCVITRTQARLYTQSQPVLEGASGLAGLDVPGGIDLIDGLDVQGRSDR